MTLRPAALALVLLLVCPLPSFGQAAPVPFTAAPSVPVHLIVNDTDVAAQTAPLVVNGVLVLPADAVARAFGATTAWDTAAKTLTLTGMSGTVVRLVAGQARAQVDGAWRDLPAPAGLRDGIFWAPSAALLRALGAYVVDTADGTEYALAQVTNVAWQADGGGLAVRVSATGPVRADAHLLRQPDRLVLDLGGAITRLPGAPQDIGVGGVARVRAAQFQVRPFITRLVFDLDHPVKFAVAAQSGGIALALGDAASAEHPGTRPACDAVL